MIFRLEELEGLETAKEHNYAKITRVWQDHVTVARVLTDNTTLYCTVPRYYDGQVINELSLMGFSIHKVGIDDDQHLELKYFSQLQNLNYIAKDESGKVFGFEYLPTKAYKMWHSNDGGGNIRELLCGYPFLNWEDKEPVSIARILQTKEETK